MARGEKKRELTVFGQRLNRAIEASRYPSESAFIRALLQDEPDLVTPMTIYRWKVGLAAPNGTVLAKMADLLGCSTDYLLGREERMVPAETRREVEEWLASMGDAVSQAHAEELRATRFYGEVTDDMLRGLWAGMLARDRGKAVERPVQKATRSRGKRPLKG